MNYDSSEMNQFPPAPGSRETVIDHLLKQRDLDNQNLGMMLLRLIRAAESGNPTLLQSVIASAKQLAASTGLSSPLRASTSPRKSNPI